MNLKQTLMEHSQDKNGKFIVCGASSGFGHAVAKSLLNSGSSVIAVARREVLQ